VRRPRRSVGPGAASAARTRSATPRSGGRAESAAQIHWVDGSFVAARRSYSAAQRRQHVAGVRQPPDRRPECASSRVAATSIWQRDRCRRCAASRLNCERVRGFHSRLKRRGRCAVKTTENIKGLVNPPPRTVFTFATYFTCQ
jgi:hypothetical protein